MLRHPVAVGWLESGVHIKAVTDLLGHSSISITGDVYGHTTDEAARGAVDGAGIEFSADSRGQLLTLTCEKSTLKVTPSGTWSRSSPRTR